MSVVVEASGLGKTFGEGALAFTALRDVDLTVHKGELLILSGPSGSGKTTLLSLIGCVLRPTTGTLRLFGTVVSGMSEAALAEVRREKIGFVFQGHNLIASLTARENVATALELRGVERKAALAETDVLLERVGLTPRASARPDQLSGGQRQRVAIARAVAGSPPLLLADEPTASLDAQSGQAATALLRELCRERGVTAIVVTHDERIFPYADRVLHIEDGRLAPPRPTLEASP